MIKIVTHFTVKDNHKQEALRVLEDVIAKTRRYDTGCIEYDLYQDTQDDSKLLIIETWRTQEDIETHTSKDHTKEMGERIQPHVEEISFSFYDQLV